MAASSAIPAIFNSVDIDGTSYIDGGIRKNADLQSAIDRCLEIVDNESQITLDVILLNPPTESDFSTSIMSVVGEIFEWFTDEFGGWLESGEEQVVKVMQAHPDVNYRYLIRPETALVDSEMDILDCEATATDAMQIIGGQVAKSVLEAGPGKEFQNVMDSVNQS